MWLYSKNIYLVNEIISGYIEIEKEKIKSIKKNKPKNILEFHDYTNFLIIPGFIDIHNHGWGTGSLWEFGDKQSYLNMKKDLVDTGVTSFLATSGADSIERINSFLDTGKKIMENQTNNNGSQVIGFHLEGPFLGKEYKGMQKEEYCINPSVEKLNIFLNHAGKNNVKLLSLAPELDGAEETIKYARSFGIQVSAAHTSATFDEIKKAMKWGINGVCHMYSGMRGLHHRELGVVGAVMYFDELYAEFPKQTGIAIKPEAFEIIHRLKGSDKIILTTDTIGVAMTTKEKYNYFMKINYIPDGNHLIIKHDSGQTERINRTKYKNIKNVELSFLGSVKNLLAQKFLKIEDIIKMSSINPAKYINIYDTKGSIEEGKDADLLIIDKNFDLKNVFVMGKKYDLN